MSEEENILDIADSDIESMSAQEAQTHIDRVMRAGEKHPYFSNANMKEHRVAMEKVGRLYQVVSPQPGPLVNAEGEEVIGQWPPHLVRRMETAMQEQDEQKEKKQQALRAEAETLLDEMDESGFFEGRNKLDLDNVTEWKLDLWRLQKLNHEGKFKELLPKLEQHIQKLKLDVSTFRSLFWDDKMGDDDKANMVGMLLERIWDKSEQKFSVSKENLTYGGKKKPAPKMKEQ